MSDTSILMQLSQLRKLFAEAIPEDAKTISDYAWVVVKALLQHTEELDSITSRQLLADCIKLPLERPSKLYSALLSAAVKVAAVYPEFRFAAFLKLWGVQNLRPEDGERQKSADGKSFPSLVEKTTKALAHSILLHPEDCSLLQELSSLHPFLSGEGQGERLFLAMLVTRIKEAVGKDGRKYVFVTLTSPDGIEVETVSHSLQPHPLHPLPEGKRHWVNIGQLYDCLLCQKQESPSSSSFSFSSSFSSSFSLTQAYLSQRNGKDVFGETLGYIESIDPTHSHMHIYDGHSRHFVAPILRFSKERVGDFVRFIPIIPRESKFKTAIITDGRINPSVIAGEAESSLLIREIRITTINTGKHYATWELADKEHPITELLSPLQLSQGETSPSFTTGYLSLTEDNCILTSLVASQSPLSSSEPVQNVIEGSSLKVVLYLKRGKDRQKRPHIARIIEE